MQEIAEYHRENCYLPTSGMCFIKCFSYFTKIHYTEEFLTSIRSEQKISNVMTSARIQPLCREYCIEIGCFDGTRINQRNITQRNTSLFKYINHFRLIWKSDGISFDKAKKELKDNFTVVDNVVADKHVKTFIKHEYNPKKVKSPLTKIIVYDLETFNKIRAVPYCSCLYKLNKVSGKCQRDMTGQKFQKCLNDCGFLNELIVLMKCQIMFYHPKENQKNSKNKFLHIIFNW